MQSKMFTPVYCSSFISLPIASPEADRVPFNIWIPLPFLWIEGGYKRVLLPSGLGYLATHVTIIIIAIPHSLLPLLHLLLSLVGVLLPCMMQYILTNGTCGHTVIRFCIPQI